MIKIQSLTYSYRPKAKVLNNLNAEFKLGATYGLLGKNGSGKSTLLRCLSGLLHPKSGRADIASFVPQQRQPDFLSNLFFLPEEIYLPNIPISAYIKSNQWMYPKFSLADFNQLLKEFDIPQNQSLQEMSYGQKKKVLLSFALATNTDYLFMDEPTNGLDILSKSQFRKIMAGYMNSERCVIISSHQLKDLDQLIDHISILEDGKMLLNENIERISQKLKFCVVENNEIPDNIIYSETMLTHTAIVTPNDTGNESIVDLELLYKSVLFNQAKVAELFC